MPETLDHKTFDLGAVLAGRTYPEDTFNVFLDAAAAAKVAQLERDIAREEARGNQEKADAYLAEKDALMEQIRAASLKITVQAIPLSERRLIQKDAYKNYPEKKDILGRAEQDSDRDEYYTIKMWTRHITSIGQEGAEGSMKPEVEDVKALRDVLPEPSQQQIQNKIDGLYEDAFEGFEQAAQDTDFSSAVSPEA